MMEYYNNILVISLEELKRYFSVRTIHSWGLEIVKKGGGANNYTLYSFRSLPEKKQALVRGFLEVKEKEVSNGLMGKVVYDLEVYDFFNSYKLPNGNFLPDDVKKALCNSAFILNAMKGVLADAINMRIKTQDRMPKGVFGYFVKELALISADMPHTLPKKERALQRVFEYYTGKKSKKNGTTGYLSLISDKYCNSNGRKVGKETDLYVLLKLISHHNQFDSVWIAERYNKEWAIPNGRKPIDKATVLNYAKDYANEVMALRDGYKKAYGKVVPIIRREAPSAPLLFVGSDDCHIDWYFRLKGVSDVGNDDFFRPKMVIVMDACCRYILGWACGMSVTADLVKMAYLNALHHIKELTGGFYSFQQIQYDRFGMKSLEGIYKAVSEYDFEREARGKSHPRKRVIEGFFSKELHKVLKLNPHGYSGHNWDAKSKINSEHLQGDMKNYPVFGDLPYYMHWLVSEMRNSTVYKGGMSRRDMWLEAWNSMAPERRRVLDDVARLKAFGILHCDVKSKVAETYTLRNDVISPKLLGFKREYLFVDEGDYIANYGVRFNLLYDPYDLGTVLAVNEDGTRSMLLREVKRVPMAVADYSEGSRALLNFRLGQNKRVLKYLKDSTERIIGAPMDVEGMLRINMEKGLQQAASDILQLGGDGLRGIDGFDAEGGTDEPVYTGGNADYGTEEF